MKYNNYNMNKLRKDIKDETIYSKCRKRDKDFTRDRKITPRDLIYYLLNNRGKTTKMELYDFIQEDHLDDVSSPTLLKQREKLNEEVFKKLNKSSLIDFINYFQKKLKHLKDIY